MDQGIFDRIGSRGAQKAEMLKKNAAAKENALKIVSARKIQIKFKTYINKIIYSRKCQKDCESK